MSNTRETLNKVKPTKTLIIVGPMPCEQQAAAIRNYTVDAMKNQKTDVVAYRYLQSRQGRYNTAIEASLFTLFSLVNLLNTYSLIQPNEDDQDNSNNLAIKLIAIFPAICFLYCVGNVLPNIANAKRYSETASGCEEWLQKKTSKNCLKDIKQIGYPTLYTTGTLSTLKPVLQSHNLETAALSAILDNRRKYGKRT